MIRSLQLALSSIRLSGRGLKKGTTQELRPLSHLAVD